jgi:hypothetical protein
MNPLAQLLIQDAPLIVGIVGQILHRQNPTDPAPTSEAVIAALESLFTSSLARDEFLLAALRKERT